MNVNILFTGQSNAAYYSMTDAAALAASVARQLGFSPDNGNTVTSIGGSQIQDGAYVNHTTVPSIALQPPLAPYPSAAGFLTGTPGNWSLSDHPDAIGGQQVMDYLQHLSPAVRASPTVIVWMHNESDSTVPDLVPSTWASAAAYYVDQLRTAGLGQNAATTPVVFVNVPFHSDMPSLFQSSQAIRDGVQTLTTTPGFNAVQGPQTAQLDMSGPLAGPLDPTPGTDGGPHMSSIDKASLDQSLAPILARQLQAYALPGSAAANALDSPVQPVAWLADTVSGQPDQMLVHVLGAADGLAPLSAEAAAGVGWSLATSGTAAPSDDATSAQVVSTSTNGDAAILLTFQSPVATGGTLYYGYADSRLSDAPTGAAEGNQVQDGAGRALVLPDAGLTVGQATAALPANILAFDQTFASAAVTSAPGGKLSVDGESVPITMDTIQFSDGEYLRSGTQAALIDRLYEGALGHHVDAASLSSALQGGYSVATLARLLLSSQEYAATQGTPGDAQFVTSLYAEVIGRAPSAIEVQTCLQAIQGGVSRAALLVDAAESQEASSRQSAQGFGVFVADQPITAAPPVSLIGQNGQSSAQAALVDRLYEGALGRHVDAASLSSALHGHYSANDLAQSLLASQEYAVTQGAPSNTQFVANLYADALGRTPCAVEVQACLHVLQHGVSHAALLVSAAQSPEALAQQSASTLY